jgi:exopolysaccharide production protein ExoZ
MSNNAFDRAGPRLNSLEIGRGVAALFVVLYHFYSICAKYFGSPPSIGEPFRGGHAGVEYFFALSGFIIFYVHAKDIGKRDRIFDFFKKRFVRIIPMYWIIISCMLISFVIYPHWGAEKSLTFFNIIRDYLLIPREGAMILPPAWTLEREFIFYIVFSVCIFAPRLGVPTFLLWQCGVVFANIVFFVSNERPDNLLWVFFGIQNLGFLAGVSCAWLTMNYGSPSRWKQLLIFSIGAAIVLATMAVEAYLDTDPGALNPPAAQEIGRSVLYAASFGLIIYGCVTFEVNSGWISGKYLTLFGASSYLIYLIHEPLASVVMKVLTSNPVRGFFNPNSSYLLAVALVLAAAAVLHVSVEKPVTRYLRKILIDDRRRRPRTTDTQGTLGDGPAVLPK